MRMLTRNSPLNRSFFIIHQLQCSLMQNEFFLSFIDSQEKVVVTKMCVTTLSAFSLRVPLPVVLSLSAY